MLLELDLQDHLQLADPALGGVLHVRNVFSCL